MELVLSRLSRGDCAATLGPESLRLRGDHGQTLVADERAFRQVVAQLAWAAASSATGPVTTSGPRGFELGLDTHVTQIDAHAEAWRRATRGRGPGSTETCDGRNDDVRGVLVGSQLRVEKGLPLGLALGASAGTLAATGLVLVGADLRLALLEEAWDARLPDVGMRVAVARPVGAGELSLVVTSLDALVSKRFVVRWVELSPSLGAGLVFTHASVRQVDLTPNIDALACRAGTDAVCNRAGLGASDDDLGHDVHFASLRLLRTRIFAGLRLRHRMLVLAGSFAGDLLAPRLGRAADERLPRQWTVSVSPGVSF